MLTGTRELSELMGILRLYIILYVKIIFQCILLEILGMDTQQCEGT